MNARNIVLLGESGVGKSSIINMVSGTQTTKTSNNVLGDGSKVECYVVTESGLRINFWEMKGFAGDVGVAPTRLLQVLKTIVRRLLVFGSIDLLILCMRSGRITNTIVQGYHAIYVEACARRVPIALVVNGLERSPDLNMHGWWARNKDGILNHGLAFDIHVCVTTLRSDEDSSVGEKIKVSQRRLRELVKLPDYFGLPHDQVCPGSETSQTCVTSSISFYELTPEDIVVFLVGRTGCGKSSFIRKLAGISEREAGVSHELVSKPKHVVNFKYEHPNSSRRVVLVDTPGYTDPDCDPTNNMIRTEMTGWLQEACKRDVVVCHILYLYTPAYIPKNDPLRPFWKVYGDIKSQLTRVKTTAGCAVDQSEPSSDEAVNDTMIHGGVKTVVYEDTQESACSILQQVTKDLRVAARVQLKKVISDTAGGFWKFGARRRACTRLQKLVGEHLEVLETIRDNSTDDSDIFSLQEQLQRQRSDMEQIMIQIGLKPSLVMRINHWLDRCS